MSNDTYGRGLYPFVGLSTDSRSPTSDPSASTWATKPLPGQRATETDSLITYEFVGNTWRGIAGPTSDGKNAELVVAHSPYFGAGKLREYKGSATTRQRFTWPAGTGPKEIYIRVYTAAVSANLPLESIKATFDAESIAVADANLVQTGGELVDMQNETIQVADGWYRKTFSVPLETIDFVVGTATISAVRVLGA